MAENDLKPLKRASPALKKGLTLTELLITVAILVIACSMLFLIFVNCIILNESSRNLTRAITHVQYVMEEIKDSNFSNLKTNIDNGNWDWNTAAISAQGLEALDSEMIDTDEIGTDFDLLDVVINLTWQERGGRVQNINLETLIAQP